VRPDSNTEHHTHSRHRLEKPPKNRHVFVAGSLTAAFAAVALSVGVATGGGAVGATAPVPTATRSVPASAAPAVPVDASLPTVQSGVSAADGASTGPVTGGTVVTVTGADLAGVTGVTFGGNAGTVVSATDTTVTIMTPHSTGFNTGLVAVALFDSAGQAVQMAADAPAAAAAVGSSSPASVAVAGSAVGLPAAPSASVSVSASVSGEPAAASATHGPLTFSYVPDPRITAQISYVLAHWDDYNSAGYGAIGDNDCVNFASQSLQARGWAMDADWSFDPGTFAYSPAWASSTAFADYLARHPERGTALTDEQRDLVKVGDIVQFDWDRSGDKDHTGIVTRVDRTGSEVRIYYAGHTSNTDYKSVDESLANTGGSVSYWSLS
jgi:hypothetical protein